MPNLQSKISAHNKNMLKGNETTTTRTCNCRVKAKCPLAEECLKKKRHLSGCRNNPPWEGILRGSYRD